MIDRWFLPSAGKALAGISAFRKPETSVSSALGDHQEISFYRDYSEIGRIEKARIKPMSKNQRQTPRKPATKFPNLQKKMEKQKLQVKKSRKQ